MKKIAVDKRRREKKEKKKKKTTTAIKYNGKDSTPKISWMQFSLGANELVDIIESIS